MIDPGTVLQDAQRLAALALAEDGTRDITSDVTIGVPVSVRARLEARQEMVLAGVRYADAVAQAAGIRVEWAGQDGDLLAPGAVAGTVLGRLPALLRAERSLLNLLQRASGIATLTRAYVQAVAGTSCRILHTRKTAPGLRIFDVQAALAAGAGLHRVDLASIVMVKDNHWAALRRQGRSLADALDQARREGATAVQVEVETPAQLKEACEAGADRLLIDNQSPETLAAWGRDARRLRPGVEIEATGGITLDNVRAYALAGADFISIGALTHSVRAADLSLEIV